MSIKDRAIRSIRVTMSGQGLGVTGVFDYYLVRSEDGSLQWVYENGSAVAEDTINYALFLERDGKRVKQSMWIVLGLFLVSVWISVAGAAWIIVPFVAIIAFMAGKGAFSSPEYTEERGRQDRQQFGDL